MAWQVSRDAVVSEESKEKMHALAQSLSNDGVFPFQPRINAEAPKYRFTVGNDCLAQLELVSTDVFEDELEDDVKNQESQAQTHSDPAAASTAQAGRLHLDSDPL